MFVAGNGGKGVYLFCGVWVVALCVCVEGGAKMDLWVVAAVAGAWYLAKYWNRFSKNGDGSSHFSLEDFNFENPESLSHPFCKQAQRDELGNDVCLDSRALDVNSPDGFLTIELAYNKGLGSEKLRSFRNCNESDDVLSASNFNDGNVQSTNIGGNCGFLLPDLSAGEVGSVHKHSGNKTSLRTKHLYGHISRPLNSLESCLMAQLCKQHVKMEERVFSSLSSLPTATRSFLVSDRSQIISTTNDEDNTGSEENKLHREVGQVKDENLLFGVPYLPKTESFNDAKKMKSNAGNEQSGRLSSSNDVFSGSRIHTQHDATFLFSLGISFGIITSILANKREMDKLRKLLKQTENLVQDLHEELEIKDSMTVKELHSENYGSQDTCDHSFCDKELNGFYAEQHMDNSPIIDCKKSYDQKEEESSDAMSKIEAELEAELERLGLNMNESSQERTLSELLELDPDFVADFAQGELQTDMINGKDFVHPKLNDDAGDNMSFPANYAVSAHELSLRLHEVIQSRLEERVNELEIALQNSQRKVRFMESEHEGCSQKYFPSSFTKGNILTYDGCDLICRPQLVWDKGEVDIIYSDPIADTQVMNLSGEALGAHNDACEELIRIPDLEENSPSGIHSPDHKVCSCSHDWHVLGVQHCGTNGPLTYSTVNGERLLRELSSGEVTMLEGQSSSIHEINDVPGDENCDCDYEVERQLIRQIVERTKKGSPVFKNARRILNSMDEGEH
ncbi:uncharacterized protein LOC133308351 [Gastrolobium bilobum]|uniref:uncharacterized protein LOC133308351 n=1 Tax=Gastrolobium bilobum TaxID=150636 RepID=UPI002AAFCBE0|nr:uncharacterized protein LOC133308351 [Gastrolobium bilobum]